MSGTKTETVIRHIDLVIPCYNSAECIERCVTEIRQVLEDAGYTTHFVLVNDGSPDNTWQVIRKLVKDLPRMTAVSHTRNYGEHNAVMTGLRHTKGDAAIIADDDLQHPPESMLLLLDKLKEGHDVVFGRYATKQHSLFRNLGSKANGWLANLLLDKPKDLYLSSFKAIHSRVVPHLTAHTTPFPYLDGIILWTTKNLAEVIVPHRDREVGQSNYNLRRLVRLALNMFTGFSVMPLRIASVGAVLMILGSFILGVWIIIEKILDPTIQAGWPSLIIAMMTFNAFSLLILGLIGEYVGRIFLLLNSKPQACIGEQLES